LQRSANRLLYGERDDPYALLSRLGQRLEATLAPEALLPAIVETTGQALKLPYVAILIRQGDALHLAAAYGMAPDPATLVRLPLVSHTERVGELALAPRAPGESFAGADLRLLQNLAQQMAVAVHNVRLTADLRQLTAELQQSRERLVVAREDERRRLRRDLHDGLGPQLASQTLTLSAARTLLRRDPDAAETLLADATAHAQQAITDIRRLIYALRPPALDDLGLVAALQEQIHQYRASGVAITLRAPEQLPPLPAAVEVACYRIAQEALTNVVRHAHARNCAIQITIDSAVALDISDDGQGLPPVYQSGVGLNSMRERAAELSGTFAVEPGPSGGTWVRVRLPLP
jgi:signal transduction histidine kinase